MSKDRGFENYGGTWRKNSHAGNPHPHQPIRETLLLCHITSLKLNTSLPNTAGLPFLVFSNHFDIRRISTTGDAYVTLVDDVRGVNSVAVDAKEEMLYWADQVT